MEQSDFDLELRRGSLQLWQFLIALLEDPSNCAAITWTGRGMEFKLIEPEEVRPSLRTFEVEKCEKCSNERLLSFWF